jgi:cobalt-zinc-cadmium efflux system outer membrane protein
MQAAPAVTLAELEQLAARSSPALAAAQASLEAARARAQQAGAWPNPVVGFAADEIKRGGDPRGAYGVFGEQTIVLGSKLALERAALERAADAAEAELEVQRQRLALTVRAKFYEALALERRVAALERLATLASEGVGVSAQMFNVGLADRPDHLQSQIESRRADLEVRGARNRLFAVRQQMAALVGDDRIVARPLAGSVDDVLPELTRQDALAALIETSPQMRAARAEIALAQADVARARRQTTPDLFVRGGAAHNRELGEPTGRAIGWEASIEAGVSIPLFNRNTAGVAAATADVTRAQANLRRTQLALSGQMAAEFAVYLTAVQEIGVYREEILPRAEEAYRLYLARYREMGANYTQVIDAQRNLFELSARFLERLDTAWQSALRIQGVLVGTTLETSSDLGDRP